MRIGRKNHSHRAVARFEQRSPGPRAERCDDLGIAGANAGIQLQRSEPKIEQNRRAVLRAQSVHVGPDFGEGRAPVHRADVFRQAQRDAMAPALRCQRFRSDRPHLLVRNDPQAPARGDGRDRAADAVQDDVFVGVAHEFGDRAEAADAPGCLSIGQMTGKKVGLVIWFVHVPPAALVKIGGLAKDNAPTSRRTSP